MFQKESRAAYFSASTEGVTQIGLHVVVYNALAGDLLRAGEACRNQDIPGRCSASNRALLLLGHLEAWASDLDNPQLAASLQTFYGNTRQKIVRLQNNGMPVEFEQLAEDVQGVRGAWQTKEQELMRKQAPRLEQGRPSFEAFDQTGGPMTSAWCA